MNNDLMKADAECVWHPFTSLQNPLEPVLIKSAEGVYLHAENGQQILDAVSSWWVNIHGHAHPFLAKAIYEQALKMEHVIFAGFTHEPAIDLARKLIHILPGHQEKIFYSDNGSTAVEVAIKMALQFWVNKGNKKSNIVALDGAYHGDTFGAMSVGERSTFTQAFADHLFHVDFLPFPSEENHAELLLKMEEICSRGNVAAFIYEPLLQGSAGMRTYSVQILEDLMNIAKAQKILCIADEVMTGFGRTGKLFASEYLTVSPDIISLSKGLTGGMLPMGVTSCNGKVVEAFQSSEKEKTFYHGHSYTANPIGCAAALASMELLLKPSCEKNRDRIARSHEAFLTKISYHQKIKKICHLGTMISFELNTGNPSSYFNQKRNQIYTFFLERNILLRPLGNVIYILPPYIITNEELSKIYAAIEELLEKI